MSVYAIPGQQGAKKEQNAKKEQQAKKKMTKSRIPYEIFQGHTVQLNLTQDLLTRHNTCILWDTANAPDGSTMTVIRLPKTYQNLLRSEELEDIFNTSGLGDCVALPLNGVGLPRVYSMPENLKEYGATMIPNLQGEPTKVRLTKQTVQHALLLSMSPFTVKERRSHVNLSKIFENPKNTGNRYT